MIYQYYTVMIRDTVGFSSPVMDESGKPHLLATKEEAEAGLKTLCELYEKRLAEGYTVERRRLFGRVEMVKKSYSEQKKTEMRWFLKNAFVQKVTLTT